jgi:hypothetical protein
MFKQPENVLLAGLSPVKTTKARQGIERWHVAFGFLLMCLPIEKW